MDIKTELNERDKVVDKLVFKIFSKESNITKN